MNVRKYGLDLFCAFLLSAVLLVSMVGCASASLDNSAAGGQPSSTLPTTTITTVPTEPTPPADSFDYAKFGTTKEEVEAQIAQYGKASTELDISDFAYGKVFLKVYPFAITYSYEASDFVEVGCTEVVVIGTFPEDKDMPTKLLLLRISDETKQGVKDAIATLIQRPDVYCATPDYENKFNLDVTVVWDLTDEAKQAVSAAWLAANKEELDWEAKNNLGESCVLYLGAYNGKYAVATIGDSPNVAVDYTYKIGPYTLVDNCPFDIIVCIDGKLTTLSAAYEQELLTADETMSIVLYLTNFFTFAE